MSNFTTYILTSLKDNKHYIGLTANLDRRLAEHFQGHVKSTRNRRPLKLIYKESFNTKKEAATREKFFKSGIGREELKKIFNTAPWPSG